MHSLEHDGFAFALRRLDDATCDALTATLPALDTRRGGVRNLLAHRGVLALLRSAIVRELVLPIVGADACAVKATLFDKTPNANWKVPWHQDRAIAVASRVDAPGFGAWTRKRGVLHVEAPATVLASMLALRIHLDDCSDDSGPLRVLPGTHRLGVLSAEAIASRVSTRGGSTLPARRGELLVMRPLLVHASSPARTPAHRRVLHVELAPEGAAAPLAWAAAIPLAD